MSADIPAIPVPEITLASTTVDDYCQSVLDDKRQEMWWFQIGSQFYRGFSRPFQDEGGEWWWRGKPQFAYPVDITRSYQAPRRMPLFKTLVGAHYHCDASSANSTLRFNVVDDLSGYGAGSVDSSKRRAIRKGLKNLSIERITSSNAGIASEARLVWNSHVERTTWNSKFDSGEFARIWEPLFGSIGTTVLGAFDQATGQLNAWLVLKTLSGTVFLDTLASDTSALNNRPNDAMVYVALCNAAASQANKANFYRYSGIESIEKFKQSMGFDSAEVPAYAQISLGPRITPSAIRPKSWSKLLAGR